MLRAELRRIHRVDVGDRPIRRGPDASEAAKAVGARAFAHQGEVYLPAEEGPVDHPETRGMLAHELTHVIQQRELGPSLPDEGTPAGQVLEAHAAEAERWFSSRPGATEPTPIAEVTQRRLRIVERPIAQIARHVVDELLHSIEGFNGGGSPFLAARLTPTIATPGAMSSGLQRRAISPPEAMERLAADLRSGSPPTYAPADVLDGWQQWTEEERQRYREEVRDAFREREGSEMTDEKMRELFGDAEGMSSGSAADLKHLRELMDDVESGRLLIPKEERDALQEQITALEGKDTKGGGGSAANEQLDALTALRTDIDEGRLAVTDSDRAGLDLQIATLQADEDERKQKKKERDEKAAADKEKRETEREAKDEQRKRQQLTGEGLSASERDEQMNDMLDNIDVEALANRLYDRLRSQLRTELLVDRERAGLLADFR